MEGEKRNAYRGLVGKPEEKRSLGKPRCTWEDNIKINLRETGWGGKDWNDLAQDMNQWRALAKKLMNIRVSKYVGTFLSS
jgi:hypothetical protein